MKLRNWALGAGVAAIAAFALACGNGAGGNGGGGGGGGGETLWTAPPGMQVVESINIAASRAGAEDFAAAGSPTADLLWVDGDFEGLRFTDRANDWDGLDIYFYTLGGVTGLDLPPGTYTVVVEGVTLAPTPMQIQGVGEAGGDVNHGTGSAIATTTAANEIFSISRAFDIEATMPDGAGPPFRRARITTGAGIGFILTMVEVRQGTDVAWSLADALDGLIPAPIFAIALSQTAAHDFAPLPEGYDAVAPLTVTITNTGNMATGELAVSLSGTDYEDFVVSPDTIASIHAGGTATFTVAPDMGLSAGTYAATVTVAGEGTAAGIDESFDVSFTVTAEGAPILSVEIGEIDGHFQSGVAGTVSIPVAGINLGSERTLNFDDGAHFSITVTGPGAGDIAVAAPNQPAAGDGQFAVDAAGAGAGDLILMGTPSAVGNIYVEIDILDGDAAAAPAVNITLAALPPASLTVPDAQVSLAREAGAANFPISVAYMMALAGTTVDFDDVTTIVTLADSTPAADVSITGSLTIDASGAASSYITLSAGAGAAPAVYTVTIALGGETESFGLAIIAYLAANLGDVPLSAESAIVQVVQPSGELFVSDRNANWQGLNLELAAVDLANLGTLPDGSSMVVIISGRVAVDSGAGQMNFTNPAGNFAFGQSPYPGNWAAGQDFTIAALIRNEAGTFRRVGTGWPAGADPIGADIPGATTQFRIRNQGGVLDTASYYITDIRIGTLSVVLGTGTSNMDLSAIQTAVTGAGGNLDTGVGFVEFWRFEPGDVPAQ